MWENFKKKLNFTIYLIYPNFVLFLKTLLKQILSTTISSQNGSRVGTTFSNGFFFFFFG